MKQQEEKLLHSVHQYNHHSSILHRGHNHMIGTIRVETLMYKNSPFEQKHIEKFVVSQPYKRQCNANYNRKFIRRQYDSSAGPPLEQPQRIFPSEKEDIKDILETLIRDQAIELP